MSVEIFDLFIKKNKVAIVSSILENIFISVGFYLKEAFRYNALHLCGKNNCFEVCEFLLNTLNSVNFIQKLYVNDTSEQSRTRVVHILDLYLNMPEKGLNETPLHFACKFGSFEVARLLLSFESCSKYPQNKHNKTPEDLICTKLSNKQNLNAIKCLFEGELIFLI